MQKYVELLREPMQVKPESLRAARQKSSSTPPHVYRLNYNESPYGLGPASQAALEEAIKTPYVYPDWFSVELKTNLAELYGLKFENIAVGPGSSAMINMLGELFINPGDEFVFGDPSYEAFRDVANDYGAVPVAVPLDDDMNYDLDAMLAAITDKTKILVVVNPNNPTGTFIDSAKLEAFIRKVPKHVITVIDEAYMEFVDDPNSYSMMKLIKEEIERVEHVNVGASRPVQELLEQYGSTPLTSGSTLGELIRRPELNYEVLAPIDKNRPELRYDIREQVNINIKYDGYITRQLKQVEQFKKLESKKIPEDMDYDQVKSLRIEAVQKLKLYRPVSIGQASRIAGVSPADVSVLLVYLESHRA